MAIQNRETTLPGIWAENAQTDIPTPPVAGVTYRDTTLNSTAIDKAWSFKTIVDSSDFNQHAFLQDTLIKEAEQYGIMRWNNTTTYKEGGFCLGQDKKLYQAKRDNQGKEPTASTDDWKIPFAIDSDIVHKTGNETISGIKTFTDNITAPNQIDTTKVTNCIIKRADNIKYDISGTTLTLKAGSRWYYANGNVINITRDIVATLPTSSATRFLFISGNSIKWNDVNFCFSGDSAPSVSSSAYWYDTLTKVIKTTTNGQSWSVSNMSLPFALITSDGTNVQIGKVFNIAGYMGITVFALPGTKGLSPNGRLENGYNNLAYESKSLITFNVNGDGYKSIIMYRGNSLNQVTNGAYLADDGFLYNQDGTLIINGFEICTLGINNGVISGFEPKDVVCLASVSDIPTMVNYAVYENKIINTEYIAEYDGVLTFTNTEEHDDVIYRLDITYNGVTNTFRFGGYTFAGDYNFELINFSIPKGAKYIITQKLTSGTSEYEMKFFRYLGGTQ